MSRRLAAHGLSVEIPPGWDARIARRTESSALLPAGQRYEGDVPAGGTENPVLHLANFALPPLRGDYGSGAVEFMTSRQVFAALVEFDREAATEAMFRPATGIGFGPSDVSPTRMQRAVAGRCGGQQFVAIGGRAFCCYVVLGSFVLRAPLLRQLNPVLATLRVS